MIAMIGSALSGKRHRPEQFHPFRQSTDPDPALLDDPGAEYDRLMKEQQR